MSSVPILAANLDALRDRPALREAVERASLPRAEVWIARDGAPTGRVGDVTLHHAERPLRAARAWAAEAVDALRTAGATQVVVVGLALGHHVEALMDGFEGEIVVYEPDVDLLRWALSTRDLSRLLGRVRVETGDRPERAEGSVVLSYAPLRLLGGERYAEAVRRCERAVAPRVGRLRVLVVTPLYGGSHPIALHAHRALGALGHDAQLLDLAEFLPAFQKLAGFGARESRRRATESLFCDSLGDGVASRVEEHGFDLVLALAQAPLGPRAIEAIRAAGALTAFWFVEDRRVFPYWREVAGAYDHVFTIQTGDALSDMRSVGARAVDYLPCAAEPAVHRPLRLSERDAAAFGSDVSFVGAGYRNRRDALRRFLDMDFRLWGSDWEGAQAYAGVLERGGARVSGEDSVRIWNASKINLNLHSSTYCDGVDPRGDFVNPRTFEIAACGAFQVVDRRSLLGEAFEVGREIVAVDSVSEMKDAARYFLDHPEERAAIAEAGRARVLRDHTYERRMASLIECVVSKHPERFSGRARGRTVGDVRAVASEPLSAYLAHFSDDRPFTLGEMVRRIPEGDGPLSEPEALFLFLSQFDDLYLAEYRR